MMQMMIRNTACVALGVLIGGWLLIGSTTAVKYFVLEPQVAALDN